jgi:hypothetical protein
VALKGAGAKRSDIVAGLRAVKASDEIVAVVLKEAGYSAEMIAEDLESNDIDSAKVVALLRRAGFGCGDVAAAVDLDKKPLARALLDAKCEPIAIAEALDEIGASHAEITAILKELALDRTFVARALKALEASAPEIAQSMRRAGYTGNDIAVAMRLAGFGAEETSKALSAAKIGKREIPKALAYAGYKPGAAAEESAASARKPQGQSSAMR